MYKPDIHNNIIYGISSFQNGLHDLLAQLVSILRAKSSKVVIRGKMVCFFYFWALFFKMYIFEVLTFFSSSSYQLNQLNFSVAVRIYKIYVLDEAFFLSSQSEYQTFQGGDMLQGALTHTYARHVNGVVLWGYVTNKIHISTCRRCMDTKLGKVLTQCDSQT